MDKFHVAARLPDAAKAAGQFAQAIAVNEIHALEIDQELLVAVAGEHMNKVAQLSATISQRESSHNIDHNDAIVLSRCDLKTHICFGRLAFLVGIISLAERPFKAGLHIPSRHTLIYPNWDGHPSMSAIAMLRQLEGLNG
jgi:hypothetical protein